MTSFWGRSEDQNDRNNTIQLNLDLDCTPFLICSAIYQKKGRQFKIWFQLDWEWQGCPWYENMTTKFSPRHRWSWPYTILDNLFRPFWLSCSKRLLLNYLIAFRYCQMKVIPDTCRVHKIRCLRFYYQ